MTQAVPTRDGLNRFVVTLHLQSNGPSDISCQATLWVSL